MEIRIREMHEKADGLGFLVDLRPVDRIIIILAIMKLSPPQTRSCTNSTDRRNEAEIKTDTASLRVVPQHRHRLGGKRKQGQRRHTGGSLRYPTSPNHIAKVGSVGEVN